MKHQEKARFCLKKEKKREFQDFLHHGTRMVICRPEEGSRGIVVEWEVVDVEWFEFVIDPPEVKGE